jgi:pyruvate/2-oxoglutarate dehydrogenase complex dihydrolipoamide acyltransferase (E2) component
VKAVKKYPSVNASFVENGDKPEIHIFNRINLGVAVGSDYGLIIPVLKGIEDYGFQDFNADLNGKIERGMKKKLKPEDYQGPTLIFNNFGFFGTTIGVQIIQYPLAATLGMGVIEKRVVPHHDGIAVRDVADFFLAFDHRILDGREAGLFLSELKHAIENLPLETFPVS